MNVRQRLTRMPVTARLAAAAAGIGLCAGVLLPLGASASQTTAAQASQRGGPRLGHVFIIMLENHAADHVIGDPNAPFITSLARKFGTATRYYGVTHPSEPNYIAATSGSTWWTNDDDGWYTGNHYPNPHFAGNHYPHANIVDALAARHIPWDAYMQAMPTAGYLPDGWPSTPGASPLYVSKHNPFILYNDIRSSGRGAITSSPTAGWRPTSTAPARPATYGSAPTSAATCTAGSQRPSRDSPTRHARTQTSPVTPTTRHSRQRRTRS